MNGEGMTFDCEGMSLDIEGMTFEYEGRSFGAGFFTGIGKCLYARRLKSFRPAMFRHASSD